MLRHATLVLAFLLAPSSAFAEIAIGTVGPMDGPFAVFGAELKNGAAQAVADINAKGGVLGEPLRLNGEVVWTTEPARATEENPPGMGIRFKYVDDAERKVTEDIVEKLVKNELGDHISERLLRTSGQADPKG